MRTDIPETDITLRDGRVVHLRAVRADDEAELLQAFSRIDAHSRYMRFMRAVKEPNVDQLRKALASFPEHGAGIIATVPAADGYDIAGSAIYMLGDAESCEFAITVTPTFGRTGLGAALMTALIESARRRGLREMEGFVLAENQPMLRLASRLGFSVMPDPEDRAVRICRLPLSG